MPSAGSELKDVGRSHDILAEITLQTMGNTWCILCMGVQKRLLGMPSWPKQKYNCRLQRGPSNSAKKSERPKDKNKKNNSRETAPKQLLKVWRFSTGLGSSGQGCGKLHSQNHECQYWPCSNKQNYTSRKSVSRNGTRVILHEAQKRGHSAHRHLEMTDAAEQAATLPEEGIPGEITPILPYSEDLSNIQRRKATAPVRKHSPLDAAAEDLAYVQTPCCRERKKTRPAWRTRTRNMRRQWKRPNMVHARSIVSGADNNEQK